MKVVILAGGLGSRISEESHLRPKPMIEIGGRPLLWHIMKMYSSYGLNDFVICCGYKGSVIKDYFINYFHHQAEITVDLAKNSLEVHRQQAEPWKVTLVDTGEQTHTGGRLLKVAHHLQGTFCMTYGDGVSDVPIDKVIELHRQKKTLATVTGVIPPGRFGSLEIEGTQVRSFEEKPQGQGAVINGGFFVLEPKALSYVKGDQMPWEQDPMRGLTQDNQLSVYLHRGFWHCMDTLRDKNSLESLWQSGEAPWKRW